MSSVSAKFKSVAFMRRVRYSLAAFTRAARPGVMPLEMASFTSTIMVRAKARTSSRWCCAAWRSRSATLACHSATPVSAHKDATPSALRPALQRWRFRNLPATYSSVGARALTG